MDSKRIEFFVQNLINSMKSTIELSIIKTIKRFSRDTPTCQGRVGTGRRPLLEKDKPLLSIQRFIRLTTSMLSNSST